VEEPFLSSIPYFSHLEKEQLNVLITVEEARQVLGRVKRNKSPGVDGIPWEFYLSFWKIVAPDMVDMMNATLFETK